MCLCLRGSVLAVVSLARTQQVVPVLFFAGSDAVDSRVLSEHAFGGLFAGWICVVSTCDVLELECVDPWRHCVCESGRGEEEVGFLHAGELIGGDGIDGAFDDQAGSGRHSARDPESAAGLSGPGSHAAEGSLEVCAEEFGAGGGVVGISSDEDGVVASVGPEDVLLEALVEDCGIEAPVSGEVLAHGGPPGGIEAFA